MKQRGLSAHYETAQSRSRRRHPNNSKVESRNGYKDIVDLFGVQQLVTRSESLGLFKFANPRGWPPHWAHVCLMPYGYGFKSFPLQKATVYCGILWYTVIGKMGQPSPPRLGDCNDAPGRTGASHRPSAGGG